MLAELADALDAAPVQHIGKLLVLWRPRRPRTRPSAKTACPAHGGQDLKFSKSGNHRPQVKKVKVLGNQRVTAGGEIKRARQRATSVKKTAARLTSWPAP